MENKKYTLGESKEFNGVTLFRVIAARSFGSVNVGDIGGWIEKEYNLSHYNNAWVYDDAQVYDDARVLGNALVSKLAQTLRTNKYHITISDSHIQIGCKNYTFEEWENFDDETISKMDTEALEWWKMYKPIIFSIIKAEGKM